jgi:glycosyltransferase involved in cell wall biosynthesis
MVTSALPDDTGGGAERYAAMLAEALSHDHDVTLLTASRADGPQGVALARLPPTPLFNPSGGTLHKLAWHARDQWRLEVFRAMRGVLGDLRPTVVHTHNLQGLSAAAFTAIERRRLPHVHTAHDFNLLCARVTMTRGTSPCHQRCAMCRIQRGVRGRAVRRNLDTLISPSDFVRDRHVAFGIIEATRAVTIRQGAPAGTARVRGTGAEVRFGYIGTLAAHKGVGTMLAAARLARGPWQLAVAGDGPLAGEASDAAVADARIRFCGRIDGAEKEAFLDALDVLVLPSRWEENAPLVIAEAAVRGIPTVVSDRGGLPETREAWIVPADDSAALALQMELLSANPEQIALRSRALLDGTDYAWAPHVARVERVLRAAEARVS